MNTENAKSCLLLLTKLFLQANKICFACLGFAKNRPWLLKDATAVSLRHVAEESPCSAPIPLFCTLLYVPYPCYERFVLGVASDFPGQTSPQVLVRVMCTLNMDYSILNLTMLPVSPTTVFCLEMNDTLTIQQNDVPDFPEKYHKCVHRGIKLLQIFFLFLAKDFVSILFTQHIGKNPFKLHRLLHHLANFQCVWLRHRKFGCSLESIYPCVLMFTFLPLLDLHVQVSGTQWYVSI